jgi:hypothetical protein
MNSEGDVPALKFPGISRRPSAEARSYVYAIVHAMLDNELGHDQKDGWMFGGIELEADKVRLRAAIKLVMKEMRRRADGRR